jgi:hypothetical protein
MNKVVLYIKDTDDVFQAVDLFEDETISVTSKIQDIRDISKIFTDFSQSFTLPASKKNNKIFKHFYNYFISEGAFDARKKVDAIIEINYIPFREGKIFLNGVKMKENKPFAYNVTFFGDTVNLTDALGDDELSTLDLSAFNHDYDSDEVETGLTTGFLSESIIYPLITHTKRLYFNSDTNHDADTIVGDLSYHNGTHSQDVALTFDDLKPAIKVTDIIDAIEAKASYGLTFASGSANNFFESTAFSNLYLWLSKTKGVLGGQEGGGEAIRIIGDWSPRANTDLVWDVDISNGENLSLDGQYLLYPDASVESTIIITTSAGYADIEYSIEMLIDGDVVATVSGAKGTTSLIHTEAAADLIQGQSVVTFRVKSKGVLVFTPSLTTNVFTPDLTVNDTGVYDCPAQSSTSSIIVSEQVPKIKTIDFLTGLFKLFNLTAFIEQDRKDSNYGKIKVLTLDDFYDDNPNIFDITKYIDSTNTDIESTVPFSEINFRYKEGKTLLMKQHKETFNDDFGDEEFRPTGVDRGKPYKVDVPFEHFKFERLIDENASGIGKTQIQWGYSAGDNFKPVSNPKQGEQPSANYEPVLTAPTLFYGIRITGITAGGGINWNGSTHDELLNYWRPSNTNENGTNTIDEYTEDGTTTSTIANKLVDSGQNFTSTVTVGDYVLNETDNTQTKVTAIDSDTQLSLADDIFTLGEDYVIYHAPEFTLNFDNEIDEWSFTDYGGQSNSLFKNFYKTYVEDAFNAKKRIFKLTAHLPNSILLNYKLNDRFQIGDKVFTINSIDTNLKTGESKLELLNVL